MHHDSRLNRTTIATVGALLVGATMTALAHAGDATFEFIPDTFEANDLTPDGRYVVGGGIGGAYRYDTVTQEMLWLPGPVTSAIAVSDDGTSIVGNLQEVGTGFQVAAIWRQSTNTWTPLGYLDTCDSFASSAYEISADGSVVVGLAWNGCSGLGFRWTEEGGMVGLQELPNGGNRASVVSSSGNVIGGFAQGTFERTPAFWGSTGAGSLIDPTGDLTGEIHGINDAGTILLGEDAGKATMWTNGGANETVIGAGAILPGWSGIPMDIANNGTVVGFDILLGNRRAWIRPGSTGPLLDLKGYAQAEGAVIGEEVLLQVCQAISVDGTRIIGHGGFGQFAWMVTLDPIESCAPDLAPPGGDGLVNGADLSVLLGSWGAAGGDLTGDGITNGADLAELLGSWGSCPAPTGACCLDGVCTQLTASECATAGGSYVGDYSPCAASTCVNNDACADAIDITAFIDGAVVLGDNSTATPPVFGLEPDPDRPEGSPSCQWNENPVAAHSSVWYSFTAPELGVVSIKLCDSVPAPFFDSTIALYSGECGSLVEVACGEDECGKPAGEPPYYSWIYAEVTPGQTYYLCVMNAGDWAGSMPGPFKLTITGP